jgi:hypothetical protein
MRVNVVMHNMGRRGGKQKEAPFEGSLTSKHPLRWIR